MSYYENSNQQQQWPPAGQSGWDHQTPPVRSGASSAVPREEAQAFTHQLEEVDRAIDNLVKSGKMFGMPGRRESNPARNAPSAANRYRPDHEGRQGSNTGPRPHSIPDFGEPRGGPSHPPSNLQNFYSNQRHQPSRGSNEAEQMMQAKRRMAAQRERELRNYHQEQQYNRTVLADIPAYGTKPDRTISPASMSEDERRELIARQRSALYGEGPFAETGGYVDETGTPRPGLPGPHPGPGAHRGPSPLAYEYGRTPPAEGAPEGAPGSQSAGPNQRSRANSNASPQSNPAGNKGVFEAPGAQHSSRTSTSSPGDSPSNKSGPGGSTVAPIGTRPSAGSAGSVASAPNPALNKRSTTPLPSPLSHGFSAAGSSDEKGTPGSVAATNSSTGATDGSGPVGMSSWSGRGGGVWGNNKSGLGVQASVWG